MQKKRRELEKTNGCILVVHKNSGETMGQLLRRVREEYEVEPEQKMTFAGRLDPLASGLVILLLGEERYSKELYLSLRKSYTFDLVFGISTDTLDVLGVITGIERDVARKSKNEVEKKIHAILPEFLGVQTQAYPKYSSKTVGGVPLFQYAREGISVYAPTREIEIYSLKLGAVIEIDTMDFIRETQAKINSVDGDFRQNEISLGWRTASENLPATLQILQFSVDCSSGTYVRTLAETIARTMGRMGIADHIVRTHIGTFTNVQVIV